MNKRMNEQTNKYINLQQSNKQINKQIIGNNLLRYVGYLNVQETCNV